MLQLPLMCRLLLWITTRYIAKSLFSALATTKLVECPLCSAVELLIDLPPAKQLGKWSKLALESKKLYAY